MTSYYSGRVTSVVFENDAQSFYVLKMELDENQKRVTVRGNVPGLSVKTGTWFGFEGAWETHQTYGRQLVLSKAPVVQGEWNTETAMKLLIGHGVGEALCEGLYEQFGEGLVDVLLDKEKLQEAPAVTEFTALHIVSRWQAIRAMFQALDFLSELNLPKQRVDQIWAEFGSDAEATLSDDPWALVRIDGITFDQADEVARKLKLDMSSQRRLKGAALYACKLKRGMGHVYLSIAELISGIRSYVADVSNADVAKTLKELHDDNLLIIDNKTLPGVTAIYEPWFHEVEKESAQLLANRVESAAIDDEKDLADIIERLATVGPKTDALAKTVDVALIDVARSAIEEWSEQSKMQLSDHQLEGAVNALVHPLSILTGLPGTGKCVIPSTMVSGPWGARRIGDFLPPDLPALRDRDLLLPIDTSAGIAETGYVYNGGESSTIRITTSCGYEIEGTLEHRVRVVEKGEIVWKCLEDMKIGDVPVVVRGALHSCGPGGEPLPDIVQGDYRERRYQAPTSMNVSIARVLGYLVSEGTVTGRKSWTVTNHDLRVRTVVRECFRELFGYEAKDQDDKRVGSVVGVRIHSVQIIRWFRTLGVDPSTAFFKSIPSVIERGSREERRAFLSSLFEGDGTVSAERFSVEYGSRSKALAHGVHYLLLGFGVVASLREETREGKPWFRLTMYGEDYDRFREHVGCDFKICPKRSAHDNTNKHLIYNAEHLIEDLMREVRPAKGRDYNYFYRYALGKNGNERRPSRRQLRRLLRYAKSPSQTTERLLSLMREDFFYDPIVSVQEGRSQVVDFGVPSRHEFLSNGFISHNTTTLRVVVKVLQDAGIPFLLVAPTGIAAKRLSSVTGAEASTIHRAFGAKGIDDGGDRESTYAGIVGFGSGEIGGDGSNEFWGFSALQPHPAKVVICDESSMVDQHLLFRLLNCTSKNCRLVFVGDAAQLPSVGPGNVLRDMISTELFPVVDLREIFRQDEASDIVLAAHAIHSGAVPTFSEKSKDFTFAEIRDETKIQDTLTATVKKLYDKRVNFQVLSPRHSGQLGVTNLNVRIRDLLNPKSPGLKEMRLGPETIREGDRIMVSKNNYKYEIFNGDVGKVVSLDQKAKIVEIKIWGPPTIHVRMSFKEAPAHLRMAYCVTVHKCLHPDTLVETEQGLQRIEDISETGVVGTAEGGKPYVRKISYPPSLMLRLRTQDGYEVTVTPTHGLDVWDSVSKKYVRREARDVQKKDFLRLRLGLGVDAQTSPSLPLPPISDVRAQVFKFPKTVSPEVAEFLGLMVGDGTLYQKGFRLAKRHCEVVDRFAELAFDLFGAKANRFTANGAFQAEINSVQVSQWLQEIGGMGPHAKAVPSCILQAPLRIQSRFLRGLFEDGSVHLRTTDKEILDHIEWSSKSPEMTSTVRTMLLRLGIICGTVSSKELPNLQIYGAHASRFGERVGFISHFKQTRCQLSAGKETCYVFPLGRETVKELRKGLGNRMDLSVYKNGVNRERMSRYAAEQLVAQDDGTLPQMRYLREMLQDHHSQVSSIEPVTSTSFCVEVPDGHQFLQNGFRGWNSQGQEYDVILMPWSTGFGRQLQRNLIYTAITRARKKVILIGHPEAMVTAVDNNKVDGRNTLFSERLLALLGE